MDPNEALKTARALVPEILRLERHPLESNLAEAFNALDQWLARGGFLPRDWDPPSRVSPLDWRDVISVGKLCELARTEGARDAGDQRAGWDYTEEAANACDIAWQASTPRALQLTEHGDKAIPCIRDAYRAAFEHVWALYRSWI